MGKKYSKRRNNKSKRKYKKRVSYKSKRKYSKKRVSYKSNKKRYSKKKQKGGATEIGSGERSLALRTRSFEEMYGGLVGEEGDKYYDRLYEEEQARKQEESQRLAPTREEVASIALDVAANAIGRAAEQILLPEIEENKTNIDKIKTGVKANSGNITQLRSLMKENNTDVLKKMQVIADNLRTIVPPRRNPPPSPTP